MGVDIYALDFLLPLRRHKLGQTLWLGRQGLHLAPGGDVERVLTHHDADLSFTRIDGGTGYSEALFGYLGSTTINSLDYSNFEGASIIHDMNIPVPRSLADQFDCIFDGGTLEHVFDFPTAISNVRTMLRTGGLFITVNAANNMLGHGFYQFSPELFWRVLSPQNGFAVERMVLMPQGGYPRPIELEDPAVAGRRQEIGPTEGGVYLMAAVRKTAPAPRLVWDVYQSDYSAEWRHAANR